VSTDLTSPTGGKRPYDRPTTADQRKRLFAVHEETNSVRRAAVAAHVGVGTYYYWRKRFEEGGYPALAQPGSHRPHTFARQLPASVGQEVLAAKREHPAWGKQRIADELTRANQWVPLASRGTVRRILVDAGLWPEPGAIVKKKLG
jgi:transposase